MTPLFMASPPMTLADRLRAGLGALIGLAITGAVSTWFFGVSADLPLLIAPMGASAVLLFAVPASPLAQPWSIIGGNLVSALIGVAAAKLIGVPLLSAAAAVGFAIAAMAWLRCLHPPGGAVALTAVVGGAAVHEAGFLFALVPVLLNSVLLAAAAYAWNNGTGRSWPHVAHAPQHPHPHKLPPAIMDADYDAVLADYGETLDIDKGDLKKLVDELLGRAEERVRR